ncbi:MAG: polysaccharide deacetylase family protein [Bacteroidales bacterium]|nr:polysaccharide deacetylase family protein [Bacteroidales bacterium]
MMKSVKPPFFFKWFNPDNLVCEFPGGQKVIYLTFDDGPVPEATPEALDILEKFDARATFFLVGDNVRKNPDLLVEIQNKGHAIGNHTFHHLNGWHTPPGAYLDDVMRCQSFFTTRLFRPPYGRFTPSQYFLIRKHFRFVLWSALTYDFDRYTSAEQCLKYALEYSHCGSVVVFHNHLKTVDKVRYALPRFLEHFSDMGFTFHPIP